MADFKHGRSAYMKYKCRCTICVTEAQAYRKKYRETNINAGLRLDATPLLARLDIDERVGAVKSSIKSRWRAEGIEIYAADTWATKLGYHPIEIWGQSFYVGCFDNTSVKQEKELLGGNSRV